MEGGGAILPPIAPAHASKSHRGIHIWYGVWSGLVCKGQCVKRVEGQREGGWREGEREREGGGGGGGIEKVGGGLEHVGCGCAGVRACLGGSVGRLRRRIILIK